MSSTPPPSNPLTNASAEAGAPMLSRAELEHLARLARLELKPDEVEPMQREMNELLGYFQQLQAVDTAGVEPMQRPLPLRPDLRADVAAGALPQAEALALAPATDGSFVSVPRTLETE